MVDSLLDWLVRLPPLPTYLVLIGLSGLENIFPPVPADVAVALGAFLAQRGEVSAPLLGVLCWAANVATAALTYALGRTWGDEFFEHGWGRRLVPPEALAALHEAYARHGVLGIFVSRFLPGVRAAVPPFAGVVGMSPLRALAPAALASGIWYAGLITAGAALGLSWEGVRRLIDRTSEALGLVGVIAALALGLWVYRRVRAARR